MTALSLCAAVILISSKPDICRVPVLAAEAEEVPAAAPDLTPGQSLVSLDFDDGTTQGVLTYTNGGSFDLSNADGALAADIHSCGNLDYADQIYWDGFTLHQNCAYTYSFDIFCDIERDVEYRLQINGGDYHAYQGEVIQAGPDWQTISVDWTMTEASDPAPRIVFNMGRMPDMPEDPGEHRVLLDNIRLTVRDASGAVAVDPLPEYPRIVMNQLGFRPEDTKGFVVKEDSEEGSFAVIDAATGESVYEGGLDKAVYHRAGDMRVRKADFSGFTQPGTYRIRAVSGDLEVETPEFVIDPDVYRPLFENLVHMLYLQRCGMQTEETFAGAFAHPACHDTEAQVYGTDRKKDVTGGWHDAGDYGRYVVTGAKTVADLLMAYEEYELTMDDLHIPESGNGVPDLLDEVRYELEWMLKMQDEQTGGVYHKVTGYVFPGEVWPQEETEPLVLAPVSTAATGDFAAVMAKASVIWADLDPAFAENMRAAAYRAWDHIKDSQDTTGFVNPPEITTGEYPDRGLKDELFWAAAELFLTGDDSFAAELKERYSTYLRPGLGWERMNTYAFYDLCKASPAGIDEVLDGCREQLIDEARDLVKKSGKDVYGMALEKNYPWGSNMAVANNGVRLLIAEKLTGERQYLELAARHLDYLLGCNGLGRCFVTGSGTNPPLYPHHRLSMAAGEAMPGMLVGGPDSTLEDPFAKGLLNGQAPAMCYIDNEQSFSTNEATIYWNSPLIWLVSAMM